jgi:hypothetical protein
MRVFLRRLNCYNPYRRGRWDCSMPARATPVGERYSRVVFGYLGYGRLKRKRLHSV